VRGIRTIQLAYSGKTPTGIRLAESERTTTPKGTILHKEFDILKDKKQTGKVFLDYKPARDDKWLLKKYFNKNDIYLNGIMLDKNHRGKGIGTVALRRVDGIAKKQGKKRVLLAVMGWNTKAKKLYAKEGYKKIGVERVDRLSGKGKTTMFILAKELK